LAANARDAVDEGDEMDAERFVSVQRGAGGLRVFRDQLQVAKSGHQRDDECDDEWQPDDSADLLRHLSGKRVDASAKDVADDEQEQQPRAHHPVQARFGGEDGLLAGTNQGVGHARLHGANCFVE
jgi:hypothetical protein